LAFGYWLLTFDNLQSSINNHQSTIYNHQSKITNQLLCWWLKFMPNTQKYESIENNGFSDKK
jgi:hypothetical protein